MHLEKHSFFSHHFWTDNHLLGPGAQTGFLPWFPSRPPVAIEMKLYSPPQTARMNLYIPTQAWAYAVSGLSSNQAGYASTCSWEDRCLGQVYMTGLTQLWTRLKDASPDPLQRSVSELFHVSKPLSPPAWATNNLCKPLSGSLRLFHLWNFSPSPHQLNYPPQC